MGRAKVALELPNGEIMGERVLALLSLVCRNLVLVGGSKDLPDSLRGVPLIPDNREGCGPVGGLEALLDSGIDTKYMIVPCDLPLLLPSLLLALVWPTDEAPAAYRLPAPHGLEPFPMLLSESEHTSCVRALESGRFTTRAFLEKLSPRLLDAPPHTHMCLRSLNHPDDLDDPAVLDHLFPVRLEE